MKPTLPRLAVIFLILTFISACNPSSLDQTRKTDEPLPATRSPSPSPSARLTSTITPTPAPNKTAQVFILSMDDNGYDHLFAYSPEKLLPVRLTNGLWDDVSPAISADGSQIAFASNRNAYWDLYTLNLTNGKISRLTDTPEFDGSPAWSPDGLWIAFETLSGNQLNIHILSVSNPTKILPLTGDPIAFDQQPSWSPLGREIAFVSNRSGDNEIWIADLDKPLENRFSKISQLPFSKNTHPKWSPDGSQLAWVSHADGQPDQIYVWDKTKPEQLPRVLATGDWPVWNASGNQIATRLTAPNQNYLVAYAMDGKLTLPPTRLGELAGLDWHLEHLTNLTNIFRQKASISPTPLRQVENSLPSPNAGQRASIIKLQDVDAPQPYLLDTVSESFQALRKRVINDTGWDALASLENAFVPITSKLDPGRGQDWLYTGRAFAINPLTINANWMAVEREDLDGKTYWRIFLRTVAQDGSQGEPLTLRPWDLTSRYDMDPAPYDQGGKYSSEIPPGYWVDLTSLALKYGWERIPALENWRAYYEGARFNEFVLRDGLDWTTAMLQVYPWEIFITPTAIPTPTNTATSTPWWYHPYLSPTPTMTVTLTNRPTYTPAP